MAHAAWGLFASIISLTVGHHVFLKHVVILFKRVHVVPFTIWGHRAMPVEVMPEIDEIVDLAMFETPALPGIFMYFLCCYPPG